ncbi:MAG: DRTGG domain-containing protein [Dehalococcoidia bacterium]
MKTLLVTSPQPGAGKTGVIAAIALRLAYEGQRVLALRLGVAGDAGADEDAAYFAGLPFARGRGGAPVQPDEVAAIIAAGGRPVDLLVLEDAGDGSGQMVAAQPETRVLAVIRGDPRAQGEALQAAAEQLGDKLAGVVALGVPERDRIAARDAASRFGLPALAVIPEDRTLYAPTIGDVVEALDAEIILGDPPSDQIIEHMLIGPLTVDPSDPYFKRRRNKAVITRSDKTDLQLAALHTQTDVLILTGGFPPSPYTIDRAAGEEVPILLTRADTPESVSRLADAIGGSRFNSEAKLKRLRELLEDEWTIDQAMQVAGLSPVESTSTA